MAIWRVEKQLSIKSMNEWLKELENLKEKQIPNIALKTADRLADEMMKDIYPNTRKIPTKLEGSKAVSGIKNEKSEWAYKEYGTGIVGSQNPHVAEALQQAGWKYDVNEHGEEGWIYPVGNGEFRWTKGQSATKKFYQALERAEEMFPQIGKEEFLREVKR